jgi:hypothetical protein
MSLSKQQLDDQKRFLIWFFIWERDLLECAKRWTAWRQLAKAKGFNTESIDAPWLHQDAGRLIKYMRIEELNNGSH